MSSAAFCFAIHGGLILGRRLPKAKAEELTASWVNSRLFTPSLAFPSLPAAWMIELP